MFAQVMVSLIVVWWFDIRQILFVVNVGGRHIHKYGYPEDMSPAHVVIRQQFQIPVLFYALCLGLTLLGHATRSLTILAWAFVIFWVVHLATQAASRYFLAHKPYGVLTFPLICVTAMAVLALLGVYQ